MEEKFIVTYSSIRNIRHGDKSRRLASHIASDFTKLGTNSK